MSATPTQVPARPNCADAWLPTLSEIVTASETAPATKSVANATSAMPSAPTPRPSCVPAPTARAAIHPAGSHTASSRASGWASARASCSSGSAPGTAGPKLSSPAERSMYSQPVAAMTVSSTPAHAAMAIAKYHA